MKKDFDRWNNRKKKLNEQKSNAILFQIRLIDTKRLHDRLAVLEKDKFKEIKKTIRGLI